MCCPWCDGKDKNFRPLRFGSVPCASSWHNEDAQADEPCKKHGWIIPCPYCRIEELEDALNAAHQEIDALVDALDN